MKRLQFLATLFSPLILLFKRKPKKGVYIFYDHQPSNGQQKFQVTKGYWNFMHAPQGLKPLKYTDDWKTVEIQGKNTTP